MSNEKKQVKTNDLFEDSFLSITRTFKKLFLADKITNTTAKICIELFDYFSTETGRNLGYKNYSITKLRQLFGKETKLLSRSTLKIAIEQIQEYNLFLIDSGFEGQEVMYSFYPRNLSSIELFEAKSQGLYYTKFGSTHRFYKNDNIFSISHKNHLVKDTNQFTLSENESTQIVNESTPSENQFTVIDGKKSFSENESAVYENESTVCEDVKSLINSDIQKSCEVLQESYIKEPISKEALLKKPFLVDSQNLSLEKKLLESELKVKAFLESEINKEQIQEVEKEITLSQKDENELDRLKGILISDYGIYEMVAEKLLKQYSTKAINECIDLTIQAEVNETIKSTPRDFLINKLKYWVEKKESVQESSSPYKKVVALAPVESDFINVFYTKKLVHISQKTLGNCVQSLITCARKDIVLEIKEKFSREQIGLFINHFQNTDTFAHKYTNDVARFWQFYNDINELDKYNQELKERNEKARLEILSKFNGIVKKDETKDSLIQKIDSFSNLNDLMNVEDNENIPY